MGSANKYEKLQDICKGILKKIEEDVSVINLRQFEKSIPQIETIYNEQIHFKEPHKIASEAAIVTNVHIVATLHLIAIIHGEMTQGLKDSIEKCKAYYGITEVID